MAKAKIKTDLVALARDFLASDSFKPEVVITIPADVVYSFESAMEQVLVSTEGFNTFKLQWMSTYRKYERQWAKGELSRCWAIAQDSAANFVARENEVGNDGQNLFDQRYRNEFVAHFDEMLKIRRTSIFHALAPKEAAELLKLAAKLDDQKPVVKSHKVSKPGSASKRNQVRKGPTPKGGGKKRGVKGSRHNKRSK